MLGLKRFWNLKNYSIFTIYFHIAVMDPFSHGHSVYGHSEEDHQITKQVGKSVSFPFSL